MKKNIKTVKQFFKCGESLLALFSLEFTVQFCFISFSFFPFSGAKGLCVSWLLVSAGWRWWNTGGDMYSWKGSPSGRGVLGIRPTGSDISRLAERAWRHYHHFSTLHLGPHPGCIWPFSQLRCSSPSPIQRFPHSLQAQCVLWVWIAFIDVLTFLLFCISRVPWVFCMLHWALIAHFCHSQYRSYFNAFILNALSFGILNCWLLSVRTTCGLMEALYEILIWAQQGQQQERKYKRESSYWQREALVLNKSQIAFQSVWKWENYFWALQPHTCINTNGLIIDRADHTKFRFPVTISNISL